jgi:NAD(P)-dependent dehydrogenase (short-subunit alcohol dehydrogenase family)
MSDKNSSCIGSNNLLEYALPDHKRIDILVNNSGYPFDKNIWYKKFHEGADEELDRIIEVDLKGSVRLSRAVIPGMLQNTSTISGNENKNEVGAHVYLHRRRNHTALRIFRNPLSNFDICYTI